MYFWIICEFSTKVQVQPLFFLPLCISSCRRLQEEELQVRPASLPAIPNPFPELCSPSGSPVLSPGSLPQPSEPHVRVENRHCALSPVAIIHQTHMRCYPSDLLQVWDLHVWHPSLFSCMFVRETEMIGDSLAFKCCFYGICLSLQLLVSPFLALWMPVAHWLFQNLVCCLCKISCIFKSWRWEKSKL